MKKLVFTIFVALTTIIHAQAQSSSGEVKVKVNLELKHFQSISIGAGRIAGGGYDDQVTLTYADADDYKNGVEEIITNQLVVTSIGSGYYITANFKSNGNIVTDFTPGANAGTDPIAISELLKIFISGESAISNTWKYDFSGSGSASVFDENLDVRYVGSPITDTQMLDKIFANNNTANYAVDVVYTISAN